MPKIKLQANDFKIFEVDVEIAKCSAKIETMLENKEDDEIVRLIYVKSAILEKVIEWCTHHKNDKQKMTDKISSWDANFLKVDQRTVFELMTAADYLDIKGLLNVTSKTVANIVKGHQDQRAIRSAGS